MVRGVGHLQFHVDAVARRSDVHAVHSDARDESLDDDFLDGVARVAVVHDGHAVTVRIVHLAVYDGGFDGRYRVRVVLRVEFDAVRVNRRTERPAPDVDVLRHGRSGTDRHGVVARPDVGVDQQHGVGVEDVKAVESRRVGRIRYRFGMGPLDVVAREDAHPSRRTNREVRVVDDGQAVDEEEVRPVVREDDLVVFLCWKILPRPVAVDDTALYPDVPGRGQVEHRRVHVVSPSNRVRSEYQPQVVGHGRLDRRCERDIVANDDDTAGWKGVFEFRFGRNVFDAVATVSVHRRDFGVREFPLRPGATVYRTRVRRVELRPFVRTVLGQVPLVVAHREQPVYRFDGFVPPFSQVVHRVVVCRTSHAVISCFLSHLHLITLHKISNDYGEVKVNSRPSIIRTQRRSAHYAARVARNFDPLGRLRPIDICRVPNVVDRNAHEVVTSNVRRIASHCIASGRLGWTDAPLVPSPSFACFAASSGVQGRWTKPIGTSRFSCSKYARVE